MTPWVAVVTGGREFRGSRAATDEIKRALAGAVVMFDGVSPLGFDQVCLTCARAMRVPVTIVPALWQHEGKRAGPTRNARMLAMARGTARELGLQCVLIAGPGNTGTADMVRRARSAGVEVRFVCGGG